MTSSTHHHRHQFCFNSYVPSEPWLAGYLHLFQNRTFGDKWPRFSTGQMPFLPPNQQCRSTEGKSITDPNHQKSPTDLILFSSTTELLGKGALLPLCWFANHSTLTMTEISVLLVVLN